MVPGIAKNTRCFRVTQFRGKLDMKGNDQVIKHLNAILKNEGKLFLMLLYIISSIGFGLLFCYFGMIFIKSL